MTQNFKIISLENVPLGQITDSFNMAFSDYFVKFLVTEEYLQERWGAAGVDLTLSYGILDEQDELVAFIVHGIKFWQGKKTAYNAGTGVIPRARGNRLIQQLYSHCIPLLKLQDVHQSTLEVIVQNEKAIHIYEQQGFEKVRTLDSYSGTPSIEKEYVYKIEDLDFINLDFDQYRLQFDFQPSWDATLDAIMKFPNQYTANCIKIEDHIKAIAIYKKSNGYLNNFAVNLDARRQGMGSALFQHISKTCKQIKVNNIDNRSKATIHFLEHIGLSKQISQYEMKANWE